MNAFIKQMCIHIVFNDVKEQNMKKMSVLFLWVLMMVVSHSAYADTSAQKFGRGLAGMTCGVMELPGNIIKETNARGAEGLPFGLAKGVGMIVTRELVGVYEFITAPFPLPAGFKPILTPAYPWSYFK
jgi:putative exosortase-associated protein (TIGR04073 family)